MPQEQEPEQRLVQAEQIREVISVTEQDGAEELAEREANRVILRRDSMDESEAATPNEVRDYLMEVVNNSREAHARAMESHDLFVDLLANSGDEDIEKARKDIMAALNTAQNCNKSMLSAVKLMLDSRRPSEGGGVVQKGQIQNNFIFTDDHRSMNEMLKKRAKDNV